MSDPLLVWEYDAVTGAQGARPATLQELPTDEEIAVLQKNMANSPILLAIRALEVDRQPRAQRDALLLGDKTRLQALDAEIAALRATLIP